MLFLKNLSPEEQQEFERMSQVIMRIRAEFNTVSKQKQQLKKLVARRPKLIKLGLRRAQAVQVELEHTKQHQEAVATAARQLLALKGCGGAAQEAAA